MKGTEMERKENDDGGETKGTRLTGKGFFLKTVGGRAVSWCRGVERVGWASARKIHNGRKERRTRGKREAERVRDPEAPGS